MSGKALLMVDLQNDFCAGGALAVRDADQLIPLANALQAKFEWVVATQDWHPVGHLGFASSHPGKKPGDLVDLDGISQVLWPDHCVQGTHGADFHPALNTQRVSHIVQKGTDLRVDSYSAFFDNARRYSTGLDKWLHERNITDVFVMGVATDYCVNFTCLDAVSAGFRVHLVKDACRGVELHPGDCDAALQGMQSAGVLIQPIKSVG